MATAVTRNNFFSLASAAEFEGVDVSFLTVDFINAMNAEIGDPQADSTVAGLALVRQAIENLGINIIGNGALGVSNTEMTYMVRTDSVDATVLATGSDNTIRDAIRAVDTNGRAASATPRNTANFSAATVTVQSLGMTDTGVNA
jgi:hypothetical protein